MNPFILIYIYCFISRGNLGQTDESRGTGVASSGFL